MVNILTAFEADQAVGVKVQTTNGLEVQNYKFLVHLFGAYQCTFEDKMLGRDLV